MAKQAEYACLLKPREEYDDGHVEVYLDPRDVVKLVTRIRKVSMFIRLEGSLYTKPPTTETKKDGKKKYEARLYAYGGNLRVSAAQIKDACADWIRFNDRKREIGELPGRVRVSRYGGCLFVG